MAVEELTDKLIAVRARKARAMAATFDRRKSHGDAEDILVNDVQDVCERCRSKKAGSETHSHLW